MARKVELKRRAPSKKSVLPYEQEGFLAYRREKARLSGVGAKVR